jgi:glycine/D-amino acid oxidase-like deaminating enzyme
LRVRQAVLRRGRPVWLDRQAALTRTRYPRLSGTHRTDVVIVGGGMTGALTALEFARAGAAVHVVEAARVAAGSTAASSALLLQEPDQGMGELARRYGGAASRRIWELSRDAVRDFVTLTRRLRIRCDLVEQDAVYYASDADAEHRLREEHRLRTRAGFDEEWLSAGELRVLTAIAARGALRSHGNAQFDPYRACLGVMRAAEAAGARVFERSPVLHIDRYRGRMRIRTGAGTIDADRVIVATGYATARFRPLAGRFRMYHTYVLATRPLEARDRRELGFGDVMAWDAERPYHYLRWTADGRLLLGGGDRRVRPGPSRARQFAQATRQLRQEFEALLPALAQIGIDRAWEGLFAMTPDSLPYIGPHHRYPGHLFALGYGGNGMTFGLLAARMLLEQWQGIDSPDHALFRFGRLR